MNRVYWYRSESRLHIQQWSVSQCVVIQARYQGLEFSIITESQKKGSAHQFFPIKVISTSIVHAGPRMSRASLPLDALVVEASTYEKRSIRKSNDLQNRNTCQANRWISYHGENWIKCAAYGTHAVITFIKLFFSSRVTLVLLFAWHSLFIF